MPMFSALPATSAPTLRIATHARFNLGSAPAGPLKDWAEAQGMGAAQARNGRQGC